MRGVIAVLLGAILLGACSNSEVGAPTPSETDPLGVHSPTPSDAPTTDDPYAIPDEITPEYVELIFNTLAEIESRALVALARLDSDVGVLPESVTAPLLAVYGESEFALLATHYQGQVADGEPIFVRDPPGQTRLAVLRVFPTQRDCMLALGELDLSETAREAPDIPPVEYVTFARLDAARDPGGLNPTPWMIADVRLTDRGAPPPDLAEGTCELV